MSSRSRVVYIVKFVNVTLFLIDLLDSPNHHYYSQSRSGGACIFVRFSLRTPTVHLNFISHEFKLCISDLLKQNKILHVGFICGPSSLSSNFDVNLGLIFEKVSMNMKIVGGTSTSSCIVEFSKWSGKILKSSCNH